ncbi:BTAD domain-containing putative transcriptional regulator [Streptomyces sp. NPDC007808]|uniref:AfsR/SARP family transcriptional regulator n=1 Tax=Streptomyces sp. NPDC007808 TaxID=3364779 RepID=UPI00367EC739
MSSNSVRMELLGPFEFINGAQRPSLPLGAQRLLAYLALQQDGAHRSVAAADLWPDCTPCRAAANLRSALCHARRAASTDLITSLGQRLVLSPDVSVDLHEEWEAARRGAEGSQPLQSDWEHMANAFGKELLPGWTDEWLMFERARWDQLRVYALETIAQTFQGAGQYLPALQAAIKAISVDPVRETAHRIAIEVHLAEGNVASAIKCYQQYRTLLQRELRVNPSPQMTQLIRDLSRS